jgi:putative transposase
MAGTVGRPYLVISDDLIPCIRPKGRMISDERKGNRDVEEDAEHRADHGCVEATGGGPQRGGDGARGGCVLSKHTIYAWKSQFGGMEVNEAEELRALRDENQRLKKLVADLSLDKEMLKSLITKNGYSSRV